MRVISSVDAFWLAYTFIVSPWSAISASYTDKSMFAIGVAFFLFGWFIFTFIMFIASLRSSIALLGIFFFLTITFLLLAIAELGTVGNSSAIHTAGGAFGLIVDGIQRVVCCRGESYFVLPTGSLAKKDD
ncbi:hypothetical protein JCM3770_004036 [Rhodotorula araucariae]